MLKTRREMIAYSFYDWTGWQKHLEKMARKGWMLDKISNAGVRYHRSEPREVQYAVTYCAEASEFNPSKPESQQTFEEFCAEAGWIKAASWHQMQVFRAPVEAPPMDTDAMTQVKTVHAAMKKNFIPSHIAMGVISLIQLFMRAMSLMRDPIGELASSTYLLQWVLWGFLLVFCLLEVVTYSLWFRRANKLAWREGKFCPSRSHPLFQHIMVWVVAALVVGWILTLPSVRARVIALGGFAVMGCLLAIAAGARALFKRMGLSAGVSRVAFWVTCFVASFVLIGVFTAGIIRADFSGLDAAQERTMPLTVDMLDPDLENVDEMDDSFGDRSPLLRSVGWRQYSQEQGQVLAYVIYESPFDWVLDLCQEETLREYEERNRWAYSSLYQYSYHPVDPQPWGGEEAWLLYKGDEVQNTWLVRWEDKLVWLFYLPGLTEEQMGNIAQSLN